MARLPRLIVPDVAMHVIQRGNNRQVCFYADEDYAVYLDKLKEYAKKYDVSIHAYVLMTNHVHLLMTPHTEKSVSQLMQSLGRYYVRYVNSVYERSGTLWEGRFKSTLLDSERYFLRVSKYIELNPVRADMVEDPADYPWSSYQGNALGKKIELLTEHDVYKRLGRSSKARRKAYLDLFKSSLDKQIVERIRDSTAKGWVLGNEIFKEQIERQTKRRVSPEQRGGDRKSKAYKQGRENQLL